MDDSRRRVLRAAGGLLAVGLAGCTSGGDTDQRTATAESDGDPSSDPTTTAPTPDPSALSLTASVGRQASADAPARIETTLSYDGDTAIELRTGPALYAGVTRRVSDVVLDAVDAGESLDASRTDGCWTAPDEYATRNRDRETLRLAADSEHTERYDVYTVAGADACLPEGSYALSKDVAVRGASDVTAALGFAIDADGTVTARDDGTRVTVKGE